ncbi:MAG: Rpn family recombination-promoting nuclease/putative transposase [Thermoanaerobaculia bacterium]|nr:Rpn family recombination-promoting nuclease/putative transposase [Thermoanaerobaculia bacterium]
MAEEHDKSYRLLFSYPRMVENLLRRYVGGGWIENLDFATLEKVSERDVNDYLVRREKDLLWRLRFCDPATAELSWFYVYVHLELQATSEAFMALRMATHKLLLLQDLVRRNELAPAGKLPPVLSVVVYTGKAPWKEARSLEELMEPLPGAALGEATEGFGLLSYH